MPATSNATNCARARGGRVLIPQPHGGAIAPFPPGHASKGGFRRHRRAALALLHEGTPAAARKLMEMVDSEDPRVAIMAAIQVLDRTLGKPSDVPQAEGAGGGGALMLARLAPAERAELAAALATVARLRAKVAGQVVDGEAVEASAAAPGVALA